MPALALLLLALSAPDPKPEPGVREAIEKGVVFLQEEGVQWVRDRKCASCHHAPMGILALNEAKARGFAVDESALKEITSWSISDPLRAKVLFAPSALPKPNADNNGLSFAAIGLVVATRSAAGLSPELAAQLERLSEHVRSKQFPDGSWSVEGRPPVVDARPVMTPWALLALAPKAGSEPGPEVRKGLAWLEKAPASESRQAAALRLVARLRLGTPRPEVEPDVRRLIGFQNDDGGWGQDKGLPSDGFATGQALFALAEAGLRDDRAEVARARSFLVRTQADDGSWPMASRPMTPGGKPSKDLAPITYAGSAWATIGLVRSSR